LRFGIGLEFEEASMKVIVTGAAGFIGYHVCLALLRRGDQVVGVDDLNAYYDPALKQARLDRLAAEKAFRFERTDVADRDTVGPLFAAHRDATHVVHLAAQAGVRHSLVDPYVYVQSNVMGQLVMLEASRSLADLQNFVYASSSSVYGGNTKLPFSVDDRVDHPVSLYAATKRAGELIAECQTDLYGFPAVGLRFFTVYGPWGRPDMAAYIFTKAIFEGRPIQVFNKGDMRRDFTYIDDIVQGVLAALAKPPPEAEGRARHKVYNLGNHRSEELTHFIEILESACGREAIKEYAQMQPGDVKATFADIEDSKRDLGFEPRIAIEDGLPRFVEWYRRYHDL
jgi:UDP-glucuronate 4-epimerase